MVGFLLALLLCCLYKTTVVREKGCFCEHPLQLMKIMPLRGILAVEIVLGHTYGHLYNNSLLYFNNRIGVWVVGIFFFLSGYGLNYSLHRKNDYLKGFIVKRVGRILFPVLAIYLINYFWGICRNFLSFLLQDWFVVEVVFIYYIWYLLYKYLPEKQIVGIFVTLILVFNILGSYFAIGSRWYGSTACFLLGIVFEKEEAFIFSNCKKNYSKMLSISIMVFILGGGLFILGENNWIVSMVMINVTCMLLCIVVWLVFMKFTIGNALTNLLGSISWQIYVSHRSLLTLCDHIVPKNDLLYMCLLFGSVITVSWLLWVCERRMKLSIDRRKYS